MKRLLLAFCLIGSAVAASAQPAARPDAPRKPALVLAIIVDQFRYDYLIRFRDQYNSGLARLLQQGAVFTNAHYEHFPTVTAIGHATFLSGAPPSLSGIVGNEWYDRERARQVTSVRDETTILLGAPGAGSSPRKLLVSTIPDELKIAGRASTRALGISMKDRSAILPVGRMADGAYWFDNKTGNFVSSTYYFPGLPLWVKAFNDSRTVNQWRGREWKSIENGAAGAFLRMADSADEKYYGAMQRSAFGNELIELFTERAIEAEKLGRNPGGPDVLAVSFSSNDYVGHDHGPDSPRARDIAIRTDRVLGRLFQFLDQKVGMLNVLVVLTADHGVAPMPELMRERKMPGGRITEEAVSEAIEARLTALHGQGKWVVGKSGPAPYLNYELIRNKNLDAAEVRRQAAEAVREIPHILRVYTKDDLSAGRVIDDPVDRRLRNGFFASRASDLFVVSEPYWIFEDKGTSHGTPFGYDTHVPLLWMGPGIKPGRYHRRVAVNDIAPTLAVLLEVETPAGSVGRVLDEALRY